MRRPDCAYAEAARTVINANPRSVLIICFFICPPFSVMWPSLFFDRPVFPERPGDKTRTRQTPRLVCVALPARASLNAWAAQAGLQSWVKAGQSSYQRVIKEL